MQGRFATCQRQLQAGTSYQINLVAPPVLGITSSVHHQRSMHQMNATLVALLKGVARVFLLVGVLVPLVVAMLELPLLWGIIGAVVGGIVTSFVRERISARPNLATSIGELVTIVLLVWAIFTFSPDTDIGEFNSNAEIIGMIFITVTIGAAGLFRKRDQSPDAPE
jgi:hypothetical protein